MNISENFDREMNKYTFIKGYKARQRARQYKENKEFVLSYAKAIAIAIPILVVCWFIAVAILSI